MSNKTTYQVGAFTIITDTDGNVVARKGKASNPDVKVDSSANSRKQALADLQAHIETMENRKRDEIEDDIYGCDARNEDAGTWLVFKDVPDFITNANENQLLKLGSWLEATVIPHLDEFWQTIEKANPYAEGAGMKAFHKGSQTFQQQTWLLAAMEGTPDGPCEDCGNAFFWQMKPSNRDEPRRHTPESFQALADKCRDELEARIAKRNASKQPVKMAAAPAATPATGNVLASLSPEQIAALPESILAKMLGLA